MKERKATRGLLLLSYLILVTQGISTRTVIQRENTREILTHRGVNKTIMMEGGDVYDCVNLNLQPAFDHPLLKDHKIQMEPSSLPVGKNRKYPFLQVAHLSLVECPPGTVPVLRNNRRDQIAVHIMDQEMNNDDQLEVAGIKYSDDLFGVRATINVYEPKVKKDSKDISQSGMQIDNGPMGHIESVVACYSVAPSYTGDGFARFHVAWRDVILKKSCYDHTCPGFVQVSHRVGLGGRVLPVSVYNGPQYVIDILIFKDPKTKNWWVAYGEEKTLIGYWPNSLFSQIKYKGNFSFWGGQVSGPTASSHSPQIGSGHFATEGYGKAAFMRNIQIVDGNSKLVTPNKDKDIVGTSDLKKYSVDGYEVNKHGMHMYYGGPGNLV
ncbi:uncharacterized protein LOC123439415 [Hordeum vulgare subsp. vulgare]|uniref:uncharacterized protein LOC123439415 n=1 Tax=Hordeum vulgare subsp. vulgare TaxID=112509 RepID=UPI00162E22C9|nr:uncharacterized protein LOC123439415 [Hordeum vulgare subsp. vulgare]